MAVATDERVDVGMAIAVIEAFLEAFHFECLHGEDAKALVGVFAKGVRLCSAGQALAARRVEATGAHRSDGGRSMPQWLAEQSGTTIGDAERQLRTARQLEALQETEGAYRRGQLSDVQAEHVAAGATADPTAECTLLLASQRDPVSRLRKKAQETAAAAAGSRALADAERLHQSRYLRTWIAADGAFEGRFRLAPESAATLSAALEAAHDTMFQTARRDGACPSFEQLEADALVELANRARHRSDGGTGSPGPDSLVIFRVDYAAWVRGHTVAGETCEADRTGPVPVETIRSAISDSIIKVVALAEDGETVLDIHHLGRTINARLRTALCERDRSCVVPGCHADRYLEIHHLDPINNHGPTSLANTCRICPRHHHQITHCGATLTGPAPNWEYRPRPLR